MNQKVCRCNKCGREMQVFDLHNNFSIHKTIGYGSVHDGDELRIAFCCDCMDEIISSCVVSPISEKTWRA